MCRQYKICQRCIMDTTDPNISFDENGICNHCKSFEEKFAQIPSYFPDREMRLQEVVAKIKESGKSSEYDCVIGLSGGLDSSYVAYQVKKLDLRPFAIHLDNGWDSELAVENIRNIVKILDIDLYTYVIDWEEFKDLQLSFLKASVVDIEILTDHAINAILHKMAKDYNTKYIISGGNTATEGIMPRSWVFSKKDSWNIKGIQKRFGKERIVSFPLLSPSRFIYYHFIYGIKNIRILNYLSYNRQEAIAILEKELEWYDYGGKHLESFFTKFYQTYILPQKFKIDKRKAHYSALICSGQISRAEALKLMEQELYPKEELESDMEYFLEKLGLSKKEFEAIMNAPVKEHTDYPSFHKWINHIKSLKSWGSSLFSSK